MIHSAKKTRQQKKKWGERVKQNLKKRRGCSARNTLPTMRVLHVRKSFLDMLDIHMWQSR